MASRRHVVAALLLGTLLAGCARAAGTGETSPLLPVGSQVPDVIGRDQKGEEHRLRALAAPTVVYFYPKDGTPGCTKEACAFRDVWGRYQQAHVVVYGVSRDSPEAHRKFAAEHRLPFPLISDEDGVWAEAFGVKSVLGVYQRVSFLIGPDGKIAKVYPRVDPGVHADQVLADATALP